MPSVHFMPHQQEAIGRLRSGNILCAGVGTGKSMTALGYYYIVECGGVCWEDGADESIGPMTTPKDLYIITTARKRDTGEWAAECDRFDLMSEQVKVVIDSWNNLHKYENVEGAFFIFDEQRVVGSGAWVDAFYAVSKRNHWILLTATPGDTWTDYIPVFVANGFYKNRRAFLRRHAVYSPYVTKFPKIDRFVETGYLETLRRRITVTMEYSKKTVPHWETITLKYDQAKYRRVSVDRWDIIKEEPIQDISRACQLMRRVVNEDENRMAVVRSILHERKRAIIFYNYNYELEMLRGLKSSRIVDGVAEWNGQKHEPLPKGEKWAYLVQYNAAAEGWNCVTTDTMIFFSQNYSYKMMTQAAGRIDRMNTPFTDLYYYTLKTDAPIDKAISRALKCKKTFNEKNYAKEIGFEEVL